MNKLVSLFLLFALVGMGGCGKDKENKEDEEELTEFQKPFLGQWQEVARGNKNFPELTPEDVSLEFRADWTYTQAFSKTNVRNAHYSVVGEFLRYIYGDGSLGHTWIYSFYEDKLRLDYKAGPIETAAHTPHFYIYKRIK
ncbi:MAG: hypothetical protein LBQ65_08135 [Tannerellaceae bacterium]|jgi:hypothetical protein|nr:hypothetical protein [Tannerellaceae bacterium]